MNVLKPHKKAALLILVQNKVAPLFDIIQCIKTLVLIKKIMIYYTVSMIYYKIAELIKKDGTPYRKLVNEIGISYGTLAKLATAKTQEDIEISTVIIDKLCRYFKCSISDILKFK